MGTNYYLHGKPCATCGRSDDAMHIGKSSAGWVFAWRGYRDHDPPLTSPTSWQSFLEKSTGAIRDEYGDTWELHRLIAKVEAKRVDGRRSSKAHGMKVEHIQGDDVIHQEFS